MLRVIFPNTGRTYCLLFASWQPNQVLAMPIRNCDFFTDQSIRRRIGESCISTQQLSSSGGSNNASPPSHTLEEAIDGATESRLRSVRRQMCRNSPVCNESPVGPFPSRQIKHRVQPGQMERRSNHAKRMRYAINMRRSMTCFTTRPRSVMRVSSW